MKQFSQQGEGLIETIITILFITVSIVALVKFQHALSYSTNTVQQQSIAMNLAIQKVESLRDFTVLSTTAGYTAYSDISSGSSTATVGNTTYTLTWTITTNTSPDYKTISIVVSWNDINATAQSITYITQVAGVDPSLSTAFM